MHARACSRLIELSSLECTFPAEEGKDSCRRVKRFSLTQASSALQAVAPGVQQGTQDFGVVVNETMCIFGHEHEALPRREMLPGNTSLHGSGSCPDRQRKPSSQGTQESKFKERY